MAAVVPGDLTCSGVHMMTAEIGQPEPDQWIANLDAIAALEPGVVVAGYKKVENDNDPKIIPESQQNLRDFSRISGAETTTAGIVARMVELYPAGRASARCDSPREQPSRASTSQLAA